MATLDYALLAEYARVDPSGLLTVVGASFDRVQASSPGAAQQVFVALRVLLDEQEAPADFNVRVQPPSRQFTIEFTGTAARNEQATVLDGQVAVILVMGVTVPLPEAGRYVVTVTLSGQQAKALPFVVDLPPSSSA